MEKTKEGEERLSSVLGSQWSTRHPCGMADVVEHRTQVLPWHGWAEPQLSACF